MAMFIFGAASTAGFIALVGSATLSAESAPGHPPAPQATWTAVNSPCT